MGLFSENQIIIYLSSDTFLVHSAISGTLTRLTPAAQILCMIEFDMLQILQKSSQENFITSLLTKLFCLFLTPYYLIRSDTLFWKWQPTLNMYLWLNILLLWSPVSWQHLLDFQPSNYSSTKFNRWRIFKDIKKRL